MQGGRWSVTCPKAATSPPYPLPERRHPAGHSGGVDAADLYQLPPEDFTAARDAAAAQARADGDRSAATGLKALRRPSVAAWLVNRLAASEAELLASLLALGPELARAQAAGSGEVLRELSAQRRSLVDAVTSRVRRPGVGDLLYGPPPGDDAALLALVRALDECEGEVRRS